MCGILGFVGTRWRSAAATALATLSRRGPDEHRILDLGDVTFGHTRLAVIDLEGGHQPMQSADGRYTIIFNGEIYNYRKLRQELEAHGLSFRTASDTEVLLQAYVAWGERMLARLDGMFAFAIWDALAQRLFIARDPMGIKPCMYAACDGGLVFASTLAPFFALPGFPRHLNPVALRDYLAFQTPLAPQTLIEGVHQLPPAHLLRFDKESGRLQIERYWSIPRPTAGDVDPSSLLGDIDAAILESVERQLVADVPVGAFLSGGIDSSLMVRYMAEAGARLLRTFTMRFSDAAYDESAIARLVAERFGCEHHELEAPALGPEEFAAAVADLDQPLADPAYVMTHALAHLTRQHVTVAISGDGGDELFCGYPRFLDTEDRHPQRPWQPLLRRLLDEGLAPARLLRHSLWGRELIHYRRVELGPWPGRKDMRPYLAPEIAMVAQPERTLDLWLHLVDELGGQMDTATLMRADLWTYLSENCLVKTDRASMAHGLEVRVPLLGQPVLERVLSLPAEAHLVQGPKSLLKALAQRYLPAETWDRPKHGFSTPLAYFLGGPWRALCERTLASMGERAPFLRAGAVQRLWQRALAGKASRRLAYTLIVLLLWLETHPLDT